MTKLYLVIALILSAVLAKTTVQPYHRINITMNEDAMCLDGSPATYYVSLYTGEENHDKFILSFEGGGWCGDSSVDATIANCYSRSKSSLGSSVNDALLINDMGGILSGDPA